jgi:fumarate reductase flavoprotein subunit
MPREQVDLVVVGASLGGLAAAVLAADRGCRTVLVERTKELGGGAGAEAEIIAAAGTEVQKAAGVTDDADCFAGDILATARHHVDPALAKAVAAQGAPAVGWLASRCGIATELLADPGAGHSVRRLHLPGERGGPSVIADLARAANRHSKVSVRTGAHADHLMRDDAGGVVGVQLRPDRRGTALELAGPVLLACGGFAADDALVGQHCATAAALAYHGFAGATGEALRLGAEVGARNDHLAACRVTPFLAMPQGLVVTTPLVPLGAILANQAGRRFVDETGESLALADAVTAQPGRIAYLLFDERIAARAREADPYFARVLLPRTGRRAETLPDLARQIELDADALTLTVDTYNGNLDIGGDPFGRERTGEPLAPPFHAIRVTGARWRTLGGLAVDATARVLDASGQPIAGLYATGGAAAGLGGDGTEGALPGTDALLSLALGRLAALDVAARLAAEEGETAS